MTEAYEPELGQALFGQPYKSYKMPWYLEDALKSLRYFMYITVFFDDDSPFDNTGTQFKNDVFEIEAYSWNDEYEQKYNFKWRDLEVSWYKYFGRGISVNREVNKEEVIVMIKECLDSLW